MPKFDLNNIRSVPLAIFVTLLAFALSTVSTGWGLAIGLQETSELGFTTTVAVGGAMSLLVSLVGYIAWTTVGRVSKEYSFVIAVLIVPFALAITTVSIFFSGAGMIYATSKGQLQRGLEAEAISQVTQPLENFRLNLASIAEDMAQVAQVASTQAVVESATGGSCLNVVPKVGEGPLYRWRIQTNADAKKLSSTAERLKGHADDIVQSVYAAKEGSAFKQAALTEAYRNARLLDATGKISKVRRWVTPLRVQLENERVIFEGKSRRCGDPALLAMLTQMDETLKRTSLDLPTLPPEIVEPSIFHAMIENAKSLASMRPSKLQNNEQIDAQTFSLLPVTAIAIIIDVVGLVAAIASGRLPPKIAYHEKEYKHRLRWLANALRWDSGETNSYFCVPLGGDLRVQVEANNVAVSYSLPRVSSMLGISIDELSEINHWEADRLEKVTGGAKHFKVYKFNKELLRDLFEMEKRFRFEIKYGYEAPPSHDNVLPFPALIRSIGEDLFENREVSSRLTQREEPRKRKLAGFSTTRRDVATVVPQRDSLPTGETSNESQEK